MIRWDYNLFIGDESDDVHVGFAAGEHAFIIAEAVNGASEVQQDLGEILEQIKDQLESELPGGLDACVEIVQAGISQLGESLHACACVYVIDNVSYLITRGGGELYISRNGSTQRLLQGSQTASGFIEKGDVFILANATFIQKAHMPTVAQLVQTLDPQKVVETITPDLKGTNNTGLIAMFMKEGHVGIMETSEEIDDDTVVLDEEDRPFIGVRDNRMVEGAKPELMAPVEHALLESTHQDVVIPARTVDVSPREVGVPDHVEVPVESAPDSNPPSRFVQIIARLNGGSSLGRKFTLVVVVILVGVLSWSVISGNSRRTKARFVEKVRAENEIISAKLAQAEKLSGVHNQKALSLIDEAEESVALLKQEAQTLDLGALPELEVVSKSISRVEQSIRKAEKGSYEEYYDMALIDGSTQVTKIAVSGTDLALLDTKNGKIHVLDTTTKSVDTFSSPQVKSAKFVALHQGNPYFFTKKDGVFVFEDAKKVKKLIAADSDWGAIIEFLMYNGNIYLVDSTQNAMYKYLVAEEGYSEKKPYFGEGQTIDLSSATAGAVDSAMYLATGEKIQKYISGAREPFAVSIPDTESITFEDVYTDATVDMVYLMDTDAGALFIVSKTGEFQKQLSVPVAKDADDLYATEEGVFILADNKLYLVKE